MSPPLPLGPGREGADGRLDSGDAGDLLAVGQADLAGRLSPQPHCDDAAAGGSGQGQGREQGDRQTGGDKVLHDDVVVGGVADVGLEAGGAGELLQMGAAAQAAGDPALPGQFGQAERCAGAACGGLPVIGREDGKDRIVTEDPGDQVGMTVGTVDARVVEEHGKIDVTGRRRRTASPCDAAGYDRPLAEARHSYARLAGVHPSAVAVGSQVSVFAGLIAAGLPAGSEVLTGAGDFTSIIFPFLAQSARGVRVREVPLERVADSVTPRTTLVAVSAVQSADGRVIDLDALHAATEATGTRVLLDTTQAVGWLPVDAGRFAYTVCGGYKWLLSPRGTAYFTVRPELIGGLTPHTAGWYAGDNPWTSIYGGPLRLAAGARRFDVSPAWHAWVAAAPAVRLLTQVGNPALHTHALSLANRFRAGLGLAPGNSAIVSLAVGDGAAAAMAAARIAGSARAGRLRLSFHIFNSGADADRAAGIRAPHVLPGPVAL